MKKNTINIGSTMGKEAEKWSHYLWEEFLSRLAKAKSKNELQRLIEQLISDDEKKMMLRRLSVIALLKAGVSYRKIGEILWISPQTISTIKKNLIGNHKNYKSYLAFYGGRKYSSGEIKVKKSFWEELFNDIDLWKIMKNPPRPTGMGIKRHILK